ncbi:MAG TPA: phage tail protein [Clostridiaceae bacterium]|mgnify:CR=1 FL=1|nr:phage tail protein [Clostridiaceae bacterium]
MVTPITLPTIDVIFKQLASNFIKRSARGIAILIIKDDTSTEFQTKEYKDLKELKNDEALYTPANYQYIADALSFPVSKVVVVRIATTGTIADALTIIEGTIKTGWVTTVGTAEDYTALVDWVKDKEANGGTYKGIVYNALQGPDSKHVVNFVNEKVTFKDVRAEQTGEKYLPSLLGILASCNVEKGSTYFVCENLSKVQEVADVDAALNGGKFILINDLDVENEQVIPKVKVGLGINSLTTFDADNTEDMRYIDIVETMDLITDDIRNTFKNDYIGKYKNNLDNQIVFISAINTYFNSLAQEDILDNTYKNYADVDVVAQRAAWAVVKSEAESWDDTQVRNTPYKRNVYLAGDIKILGAMENLKFNISIF